MGRGGAMVLSLAEKKKIETLVASGKTYYSVAREIKRDPKTVKAYAEKPEVVRVIKEAREELADMFEGLARRYVDSITDKDIEKINAYQRTIAAAAATDKSRLLRNESTANIFSGGLVATIVAVDKIIQGEKSMVEDGNQVVEIESDRSSTPAIEKQTPKALPSKKKPER